MSEISLGLRASALAIAVNVALAAGKIVTGVIGNSFALIADGIESTADIVSSVVVWGGLRHSAKPPDAEHPYGHGKAEPLAAMFVAVMLIAAAAAIAYQSVHEIRLPHRAPAWFTLVVLAAVIGIKETLFRFVGQIGHDLGSTALKGDAWHHRSDALTSAAAFVGISIALIGGRGYESADDWAALIACGVIAWNGLQFLRSAVDELMDVSAPPAVVASVKKIAGAVEGVVAIEKVRVRKSGLHLAMDIHDLVDDALSVRRGHEISGRVKRRLLDSAHRISDVTVHIEPAAPRG